ncbi:phosphoribosyltransferase [Pusillimonas sp.]|uniref:phosphoribosyltransferase n=1 Tax=Pusillimonas sp. TaxID=3040095 RepID=UPI0029BA7DFA|nr:phosphoribosyltransferase family protein [Pusillimonas sp.]MDX3894247.1 phosphoribosyltransferase family protein [Pusillimonas sp.]
MTRAYSCDYYWVESLIGGYVSRWRLMGFDAVVAIARGGLAPGVMVSTALSLPLHALSYDRATRRVSWFTQQTPAAGARMLLVEDIAGRGTTLSDSVDFLRRHGFQPKIFTLAWDDQSRVVPDFGFQIPAGCRAWFPWERESITDAFGATGNLPDRPEHDYASWAMDLDGILLPDIPEEHYLHDLEAALLRRDALEPHATLPNRDLRSLPIVTGRPEQDRARTQAWLDRHGFSGRLIMRDESRYTAAQTARHKAQAIIEQRYTHFIESDAIQALEIASQVKVARVLWWNGTRAMAVYAHEAPEMAAARAAAAVLAQADTA